MTKLVLPAILTRIPEQGDDEESPLKPNFHHHHHQRINTIATASTCSSYQENPRKV